MTITPASPQASHRIRRVIGALMVLLGAVGTVAPKRLDSTPAGDGVRAEAQRHHLTRMYAMREAALGAILLGGGGIRAALAATVGLTAVEVATAGSPALDQRARITTAVTATLCGVAAAYALSGTSAKAENAIT